MARQTEFRFDHGDKVKDRISGLVGIVGTRADHLFGCNRYWVEPQELKDGKPVEGRWFDEDAIEIVEAGVIKAKRYRVYEEEPQAVQPLRRAGGPADQPSSSTRQTSR
jgi:hypothetical protein